MLHSSHEEFWPASPLDLPPLNQNSHSYKIKLSCKWTLLEFCMCLQAGSYCCTPNIGLHLCRWLIIHYQERQRHILGKARKTCVGAAQWSSLWKGFCVSKVNPFVTSYILLWLFTAVGGVFCCSEVPSIIWGKTAPDNRAIAPTQHTFTY